MNQVSQGEQERRANLLAEKLGQAKAVINKGNNYRTGNINHNTIPYDDGKTQFSAVDPRTGARPVLQQQQVAPTGTREQRINSSKMPDFIKESFTKKAPIVSEGPKSGTDLLKSTFFDRAKQITNKIDPSSKPQQTRSSVHEIEQRQRQRQQQNRGGIQVREMPPVEDEAHIDDPNLNEYYNNVGSYYQQGAPVANGGNQGPAIPQQYPQQPQYSQQSQYQQQQPQSPINEQLYGMLKQAVREVLNERESERTQSLDESVEIVVGGKSFKGHLTELKS